jgi:DNA-binding MarR family transcriptional regulator
VNETETALAAWEQTDSAGAVNQKDYVRAVAAARYMIRKVIRIVDDAARDHGFDPLVHQALVQIFGAANEPLTVSNLAERLDVVPAFASRLIRELEGRGLVERRRTDQDKRVIRVVATDAAGPILSSVNEQIGVHVDFFHRQLNDDQRQAAAIVIFAFFMGIKSESPVGEALRASFGADSVKPAPVAATAKSAKAARPAADGPKAIKTARPAVAERTKRTPTRV